MADNDVLEWSGEASVYWPDRPGGYAPTQGEIVQAWNALRERFLALEEDRDDIKAERDRAYERYDIAMQLAITMRWNLTIAKAERDDALWEIERINGRAKIPDEWSWSEYIHAIHDIREMCARALAGSRRIKKDE